MGLLARIYRVPYHVNVKKPKRLAYLAKATPTYTDAFVLDRCRYFYDWLPTPLMGDGLPLGLRLVLRVCRNLILLHPDESCRDHFRGSAIASMLEKGIGWHSWPNWKELGWFGIGRCHRSRSEVQ